MNITNDERIELDKLMASAMNSIIEQSLVETKEGKKTLNMFVRVPRFYEKENRESYKALYNIAVLTANLYGATFHFVGSWFEVKRAEFFIKRNNLMVPVLKGKRVSNHEEKIDLWAVAVQVYLHIVDGLKTKPMKYGAMKAFGFLYKAYYAE